MIWFLLRWVRVCNSNLRVYTLTGVTVVQSGIVRSNRRVQVANLSPPWGKNGLTANKKGKDFSFPFINFNKNLRSYFTFFNDFSILEMSMLTSARFIFGEVTLSRNSAKVLSNSCDAGPMSQFC